MLTIVNDPLIVELVVVAIVNSRCVSLCPLIVYQLDLEC